MSTFSLGLGGFACVAALTACVSGGVPASGPPRQGASETAATPVSRADCPVPPLVNLLDHGPRAHSTPYQNRLRKERRDAQARACEGVVK